MLVIADTDKLTRDGVINTQQARQIEERARQGMINLAINTLLSFGIILASAGFLVFLQQPIRIAVFGLFMLLAGFWILTRLAALYAMFGRAATLVGAAMLFGGAGIELTNNYPEIAGPAMALGGLVVGLLCGWVLLRRQTEERFIIGALLLMGLGFHLYGLAEIARLADLTGIMRALLLLLAAAEIALAGLVTNLRLVTALAIVPFAQMLETGTTYFHAVYVFASPEPTLTILQMAALIAGCIWLARRQPQRIARHAMVLAVLAFVVANLAALVGSLYGDVVGENVWGPGRYSAAAGMNYDSWRAARDAFRENALTIPDWAYALGWAAALAVMILWAASRNLRGLFNAALTFAVIHGYTQFFENFGDNPLTWLLGGLAAIPLAWGAWRLNRSFGEEAQASTAG